MRLVHRYIFEELAAPFVVGVMLILVMLLGDSLWHLLRLLITKGVGLGTVVLLLLFVLPEMMATSFPLATMLAVSLGINRLVRENEWTTMRLGGVSLAGMLWPVLLFALSVAGLTWLVSEQIAPAANEQYSRVLADLSSRDPTVVVQPQQWFKPGSSEAYFYVNSIDDRTGRMHNVLIFQGLQGDYPSVLFAQEARFDHGKFILDHVVQHVWRADGTLQRESETERAEIHVQRLTPQAFGMVRTAEHMSSAELRALIEQMNKEGVSRPDQVVQLQHRYAAPVACFVLAFLCVPLNVLTARRGSFVGLLITAVLAVVYFLTMQFGEAMALNGFLKSVPVLGVWLQTIVFGVLAALLLLKCR